MSNYDDVKSLIERISGQASVITVLRIYVDICGDLETAAVLSQCVFWSDKGTLQEGWFYKSREEWRREIGIKRTALDGAISHLKELGIVETDLKAARHNSPTIFYRVDMDNLTKVIINYLQTRFAEINKSNNSSVETDKSDLLKPANPSVDFNISSYSSLLQNISSEDVQRIFHKDFDAACAILKELYPSDYFQAAPVLLEADERPYRLHVRLAALPPDFIAHLANALREVNPRRNYKITYQTSGTGRPAEQGEREPADAAPDPYAPDDTVTGVLPGRSMMTPEQAWTAALGELQLEMTRATFDTWIKPSVLISVNGSWRIGVPDKYAQEFFVNRLRSTIQRILTGIIGNPAVIECVVMEKSR